jgi:two-component system sensor histidine kinase RegB
MSLPAPGPALPDRINLAWLVRLRWATIGGQLVTIGAVRFGMHLRIPMTALLGLCGFEIAVNVACVVAARAAEPREWWLGGAMVLDVLAFTGLLYLTGGPDNPFSFLYLVPIAVAAITLRGAWTWALVALSLAGSAGLFVAHEPLPIPGDHARHMDQHLHGMWVAFGVAAAFIVYFLLRVRRALEVREAELDAARARAAREERLVSLATLAAGAAHELATPLSTIAVVAKDLERDVAAAGGDAQTIEDVQLVRGQVERCRDILSRMRADAGDAGGEAFAPVTVAELMHEIVAGPKAKGEAAPAPGGTVLAELPASLGAARLTVPRRALVQAARVLLENAHQASPPGAEVVVGIAREGAFVRLEVRDRGRGIAPSVLARIGEPFFTTKPAGQGMGLGVFLARSIAERLGGALSFDSAPGRGTTATLSLPAAILQAEGSA